MLRRDYGRALDDCLFVVGDNCATNKRIATLMGVPLVGCASHRLNLAVQQVLGEYDEELGKVKDLMIKLKGLNQSARLRYVFPLFYPIAGFVLKSVFDICNLDLRHPCDRF